jgi:hypothetical protein
MLTQCKQARRLISAPIKKKKAPKHNTTGEGATNSTASADSATAGVCWACWCACGGVALLIVVLCVFICFR